MSWHFDWIRRWDAIWEPAHLARWEALLARPDAHASPFFHPALARAWLAAQGGEAGFRPCFLWAHGPDGQTVFWPLVTIRGGARQGFARRLVPIGAELRPFRPMGTLYDYQDPVIAPAGTPPLPPGFWPAFAAELRRLGGRWFDQCVLGKLRPIGWEAGGELVGRAPYVALDAYPDFEAYLAGRKPRVRGAIRRRLRNLEAAGETGFHVHGAGEVETVLGWIPALEAGRARRYPGSALPPGFLRDLVALGLPAGQLHCSSLTLDGRAISWDIGFWRAGVFHGYIRSFDTSLAHLSPGVAHLARLIGWLYEHGARRLDFLIGEEDYKAEWTDGEALPIERIALRSDALQSRVRRGIGRALAPRPSWPSPRKPTRLATPRDAR